VLLQDRVRPGPGGAAEDREKGLRGVAPRDVLLDCFKRMPPAPDFIDDRDSLAVVVEGEDRRGRITVRYDVTAGPQKQPPLSAVARDTGFPPSIVARMILEGRIRERGVLPPERCVPVRPFFEALAERGMRPKVTVTRPA
jgi:saccharopine dehydrogenase-like NADP-dependent oxidoreductase